MFFVQILHTIRNWAALNQLHPQTCKEIRGGLYLNILVVAIYGGDAGFVPKLLAEMVHYD
jgi:hypothetical protein